ncbi:MAG: hypothetical protein JST54_33080 [Deltaproteobacteria bacterium]|nr:hypothetical protein [Deltaproteobacteria bacterium]
MIGINEVGDENPGHQLVRRVEDLSSSQFLDMLAAAPTFDVPERMAADELLAFLDTGQRRLYFLGADGREDFVQEPELKRLDVRQHDERCLVTTGQHNDDGRCIYWLCRIER